MVREDDLVVVFHSIHEVMKAEKVLKKGGADILLIPAPRQLTSDCGLAIRYAPNEQDKVDRILTAEGLGPKETFCKKGREYRKI